SREVVRAFASRMREGPVAPVPELANEQHYEVPASFFGCVLGAHRKYSGCWWPDGVETLDDAERAALEVTCERAGLADGMRILELGCGWGSLSLWMAEAYPNASILAVSNSASQRAYIEGEASSRGLTNLRVVTKDMNEFETSERFDRVVSIEMFEHMRNYEVLLRRISTWLRPGGRLFVHVFAHRTTPYAFEVEGDGDWMARHFFSGGIMPSHDLFDEFGTDMSVRDRWVWSGVHYQKTAEAWLDNLDRRRVEATKILTSVAGVPEGRRLFHRWRLFFLACAETFGYRDGLEWTVAHYLLQPTRDASGTSSRSASPAMATSDGGH
ncbi:MAG: class I SAM-dependent methyltransferase, partial [Phycisphaerales bacterium]|nr:class I SAM-dependent methyltransferase [Phycisphaerales bacterium]